MKNLSQGYEFDNILLVPQPSSITSRETVDLITDIGGLTLKIPIIASPMSGIVGIDLIKELGRLGGIGILHRFYNYKDKRLTDIETLEHSATNFGVAVGLWDDCYMEACVAGASIICVDVANGYLDSVLDFTNEIATYINNHNYNCLVMSGNVATFDGAKRLYDNGAKLIRVGIGSGQLCTTRKNTGVGVPQATAIQDCSYYLNDIDLLEIGKRERANPKTDWHVVADGGIKNSGDAVKALGCGADLLMLGSLFASCFESDNNGKIQGMASREFQEQFYGEVKKSVEGIQKKAEKTQVLYQFIDEFIWNMKSGFTYLNSMDINQLHEGMEFVETGHGT